MMLRIIDFFDKLIVCSKSKDFVYIDRKESMICSVVYLLSIFL